jgi:hypothetical protein
MPRPPDSARLDLHRLFSRLQSELLARLSVGGLFEHASSAGHAAEQLWLDLLRRHLPRRYRVAPAFVIDHTGRRSRQIDLAVFDNLYAPLLFPHGSGLHIPVESVYAVFEVKAVITRQFLREAHEKAASVRALRRTTVPVPGLRRPPRRGPILAGLLAPASVWTPATFAPNLRAALRDYPLDLGCALQHGAFDGPTVSTPNQSLLFFVLRLLHRLRALGTAPPADFNAYLRSTGVQPLKFKK